MVFNYERKDAVIEAYGKRYPIPTKTAALMDGINEINKRFAENKSNLDVVRATKAGIALFIGEEETERIFPAEKEAELDTDELSAFWWALNAESNRATQEVIAKYAPKPIIQTK